MVDEVATVAKMALWDFNPVVQFVKAFVDGGVGSGG